MRRSTVIRLTSLAAMALAVGSGFVLFSTSQKVQTAEMRLEALKQDIATERESIRVLEAEWDYLNRPQRLEHLARDMLSMKTVEPQRIGDKVPDWLDRPPPAPEPPSAPAVSPASPSSSPASDLSTLLQKVTIHGDDKTD